MRMDRIEALPRLSNDDLDAASVRMRDRMWAALAELYDRYQDDGLTFAALGRRIGRSRSQVQRWLAAPCNMSSMSAGLLAEGLDADLIVTLRPRTDAQSLGNYCHPSEEARTFVRAMRIPLNSNAVIPPTSHLELFSPRYPNASRTSSQNNHLIVAPELV